MAGFFSNPLNWQITDSLQGQKGGINPVKAVAKYTSPLGFVADSAKDRLEGGVGGGFSATNSGPRTYDTSANTDESGTSTYQSGYGSGGGAGSGITAAERAQIQAQIDATQGGIDRLGRQEDIGLSNIANAFQSNLQKLLDNRNIAERDYNKSVDDTNQGYQKSISNIDVQTNQGINSLRRLLSRFGAGASSAARELAPYAAGLQGARSRSEVTDQFNDNINSLSTDWQDFERNYKTSRDDLTQQKEQQEQSLRGAIANNKASFLQTLAGLRAQLDGSYDSARPFIDQANRLLDRAVNYEDLYSRDIKAKDVDFAASELNPYQWSATTAPIVGENTAMQEAINPYAQLFRRREEESKLGSLLNQ